MWQTIGRRPLKESTRTRLTGMCHLWDSEPSAHMLSLILSTPSRQTLALPCFPHREEPVVEEVVALGAEAPLEEAPEVAAAEAGNPIKLNIR